MKVVYVSNFLNHHSVPLCEEFIKYTDDFAFITTDMHYSQGYQQPVEKPYVVFWEKESERAEKLIMDADVVIFGACPAALMEERVKANKLSFLYTERFFKKGTWRRFIPSTHKAVWNRVGRYADKNLFVLCASAFLPYDLSFFGFPVEKCFKWGYFPDVTKDPQRMVDGKRPATILWAGRFLALKHPEVAVETARRLHRDGIDFHLNMVGEGPEKEKIRRLVDKYELNDVVTLAGSKTHEQLLEMMGEHRVFMFNSNRLEGWGAVMNEAMSRGCAVVASSAVGAVPFLIEDRKNGRVYPYGKNKQAYLTTRELVEDEVLAQKLGTAAMEMVVKEYNHELAASRLLEFSRHFMENGDILCYESGVLSPAELIKDNWFKESR